MDSRFFLENKKIKEGIVCIKKEFRYNPIFDSYKVKKWLQPQ